MYIENPCPSAQDRCAPHTHLLLVGNQQAAQPARLHQPLELDSAGQASAGATFAVYMQAADTNANDNKKEMRYTLQCFPPSVS